MRKLSLWMVLGALLVVASVADAAPSQTPAAPSTTTALASDPFLAGAAVSTAVPMVPKCPCVVIFGCAYEPIGFDCAEPAHCCSCRGTVPATRMCVGVPS